METLTAYIDNPHFYMVLISALFLGNVILTVWVFAALCTSGTASRNRAAQLSATILEIIDLLEGTAGPVTRSRLRAIKEQVNKALED